MQMSGDAMMKCVSIQGRNFRGDAAEQNAALSPERIIPDLVIVSMKASGWIRSVLAADALRARIISEPRVNRVRFSVVHHCIVGKQLQIHCMHISTRAALQWPDPEEVQSPGALWAGVRPHHLCDRCIHDGGRELVLGDHATAAAKPGTHLSALLLV
jgi:hypothetical protein